MAVDGKPPGARATGRLVVTQLDQDPPLRWWQSFFTGSVLEYHRAVLWRDVDAAAIAARNICELAALAPGSLVLDVPSGNGRYARPLSAAGMRVVALDQSPSLVRECRRLARDGPGLVAVRGDMLALPFRAAFDAVACLGGSFGYFGEVRDRDFLRACLRALRPGGAVVLETASLETIVRIHEPYMVDQHGDFRVEHIRDLDLLNGTVTLRLNISKAGAEASSQEYHQRLYTARELVRLVTDAGGAGAQIFGSLAGEPFTANSQRAVVVARSSAAQPGEGT
jgi:SAM-dependent methyltransferase